MRRLVTDPNLENGVENTKAKMPLPPLRHGPVGLASVSSQTVFVAGKTVTGFADSEEEAVQLTASCSCSKNDSRNRVPSTKRDPTE
jgi:hypothetical protein